MGRITHGDLMAVGFWMSVESIDSDKSVRVLVTYEALSQIDPSQIRDMQAALDVFDRHRPHIEAAASTKFDAQDIEPETYEGQPVIKLRTEDLHSRKNKTNGRPNCRC